MNALMSSLQSGLDTIMSYLPQLLMGIVLVLVAWIVAAVIKGAVSKGLKAANFNSLLNKWGVSNTKEDANSTIDALGKVAYYLVWVLFLPGIFQTFGLSSIGQPIQNMIDTVLSYLPNVIGAAIILALGLVAGKFVKNLVYNLSTAANLDKYIAQFMGDEEDTEGTTEKKDTLANALGGVAYVLILFPIVIVALESLQIASITQPVTQVLNSILSAIPNVIVALVLLVVGFVLAKIAGDVLTNLIDGSGANKASDFLRDSANVNIDVAKVVGQAVAAVIGIIFFVEAMNALQLQILNTVGTAIIGYIPNLVVAGIILALAFVGGNFLANAIKGSTNSKVTGGIVKYAIIIFGIFMALEQLNFATAIVQQAFVFIIGALAVAFAIAFGLGGRDFARKQLEKADTKIDKETRKNESQTNDQNR